MPETAATNSTNGTNGIPHAPPPHKNARPVLDLGGFHFGTVDDKFRQHREAAKSHAGDAIAVPATVPQPQVPIQAPAAAPFPGALTGFSGSFAGTGYNTIWRPRNSGSTQPPVPGLGPGVPGFPNDAVLELNLTMENLTFTPLTGLVPNRGSQGQADINLTAIPYVQTIKDVANPVTGKADFSPPIDIHFEPGIWLRIPPSQTSPNQGPTLTRMASIPHGTTINAQCAEPTAADILTSSPISEIPIASITPFILNQPGSPITFPQQTLTNNTTSRLPQDLTLFNNAGTITAPILQDPNEVLRNALKGQNITKATTFTVSTASSPKIVGGGIANIAFLEGTGAIGTNSPQANADAVTMTAQFWIETVQWPVTVPAGKSFPLDVTATANAGKAPCPTFTISGPTAPLSQPRLVTCPATQIQYSQNVVLNFNGLSWPHVSVATLGPVDKVPFTLQA